MDSLGAVSLKALRPAANCIKPYLNAHKPMNFQSAGLIEQLCWSLRLADWPRSQDRARINDVFNGLPPYLPDEVAENRIDVNVNFLEGTKLAHDARRQFYNAFLKPGNFFTITLDCGPREKRLDWSHILTKELNKCLKRHLGYYESQRSTFANVVLHGIGPKVWADTEMAIPKAIGVDDVLFPSQTLISMENVDFFAVYRRYTAAQLHKLTSGPNVDPGWDMDTVKKVINWAQRQATQSVANQDVWSPERMAELFKSNLGWFASDKVPTIDCWDFYHREDSGKVEGWCRKIVLDAFGDPGDGGVPTYGAPISTSAKALSDKNLIGENNQFLYNSGKRKVASRMQQIVHFQFGDLSAVAPFRYHSVRGLGYLLFAVCHLQNRLRCRFNESLFEHCLQYFRVSNPDDADRAEKINLINRGVIDQNVQFVPAAERWQINQALIESGLAHNREIMGSNASAFIQDFAFGRERTEKTATEVMAQVNAASALVGAALQQAYSYATWEYREICNRFCKKHSRDPLVRKFRAAVLRQGVPPEYLEAERWEVEPERVLGSGNKTLEMTNAEQLMSIRPLLDPQAQQDVIRDYVLAVTDDPARTDKLVPQTPMQVSNSVHDAQISIASLMDGLPVSVRGGIHRGEYLSAMIGSTFQKIQQIDQMQQRVATQEQIVGLSNVVQHLKENLAIFAQDEANGQQVRQFEAAISQIENAIRAYGQRLQQMMQAQAQQNGNGQADPQKLLDLQIEQARGQQKLQQMQASHAARTAERQTAFEMQQERDEAAHQTELRREAEKAVIEDASTALKTQAEVAKRQQSQPPSK